MVKQHARNVHEITFKRETKLAILSDIHFDNPHCDRVLLKAHLDYCAKHKIPVFINGDFFCLMQGRYDPRRAKSNIRPEHNKDNYLDAVISTSVEWWLPYAHLLTVIGRGNHETSITKNCETDVLQRFVDLLNAKAGTSVYVGGYGGWLVLRTQMPGNTSVSTKVKYYHGSGGGGLVTKGAINLTRALEMYEGFDVFVMSHIHENMARNDVRDDMEGTTTGYRMRHKQLHMMITGTYKEEYGDGHDGYHVEKGRPIKPLGGRILTVFVHDNRHNKGERTSKVIDSCKFPL